MKYIHLVALLSSFPAMVHAKSICDDIKIGSADQINAIAVRKNMVAVRFKYSNAFLTISCEDSKAAVDLSVQIKQSMKQVAPPAKAVAAVTTQQECKPVIVQCQCPPVHCPSVQCDPPSPRVPTEQRNNEC